MPDKTVFDERNIVIHSNVYRARQAGYGCEERDTGPSGQQVSKKFNTPPVEVTNNAYTSSLVFPGYTVSTHGGGLCGITMWLRVENFFRNIDRTVGCTITRACMQRYPMWNQYPWPDDWLPDDIQGPITNRAQQRDPDWPETQPAPLISNYGAIPSPNPWNIDPRVGFNWYPDWCTSWQGDPFTVEAALYAGKNQDMNDEDGPLAKATLFMCRRNATTLDGTPWQGKTWQGPNSRDRRFKQTLSDGTDGVYPTRSGIENISFGMDENHPITLTGVVNNINDPVTLVIFNNSDCSCGQQGKARPVYVADITEYIPPVAPYIWRKFGTSAADDPDWVIGNPSQGNPPHPGNDPKLDGKWHLVRPLYLADGSAWVDVEKDFLP